jgi:hypothetical protein
MPLLKARMLSLTSEEDREHSVVLLPWSNFQVGHTNNVGALDTPSQEVYCSRPMYRKPVKLRIASKGLTDRVEFSEAHDFFTSQKRKGRYLFVMQWGQFSLAIGRECCYIILLAVLQEHGGWLSISFEWRRTFSCCNAPHESLIIFPTTELPPYHRHYHWIRSCSSEGSDLVNSLTALNKNVECLSTCFPSSFRSRWLWRG